MLGKPLCAFLMVDIYHFLFCIISTLLSCNLFEDKRYYSTLCPLQPLMLHHVCWIESSLVTVAVPWVSYTMIIIGGNTQAADIIVWYKATSPPPGNLLEIRISRPTHWGLYIFKRFQAIYMHLKVWETPYSIKFIYTTIKNSAYEFSLYHLLTNAH